MINDALHGCYVSPHLCKQMMESGFANATPYLWKIRGGEIVLQTSIFDVDGYYRDSIRHIDSIVPPDLILPAYSLKEVEKMMPPYMLTYNGYKYELALDIIYNQAIETAERLPDVFAQMAIKGVRQGKWCLVKINEILMKKAA